MWKCQVIFIACEVTQGGGRFEYLLFRPNMASVISTQVSHISVICLPVSVNAILSVLLHCGIFSFPITG